MRNLSYYLSAGASWLGVFAFLLNPIFLAVVLVLWLIGWLRFSWVYSDSEPNKAIGRIWEGFQFIIDVPVAWLPFVETDFQMSMGFHVNPFGWRVKTEAHSYWGGPYRYYQFGPLSLTFIFFDMVEATP